MSPCIRIGLFIASHLIAASASAYDFMVDAIAYNIDAVSLTCEVAPKSEKYEGEIVIPSHVIYQGKILDVVSIGSYAFNACPNLTSVILGDSIKGIKKYAFWECPRITNIDLKNVTYISDWGFKECSNLESIQFPPSLASIGFQAFAGCEKLTEVTIPATVTWMGAGVFDNCLSLRKVIFEDSENPLPISSIGTNNNYFFSNDELDEVYFGRNIGTGIYSTPVFIKCKNVKSVKFGDNVTLIPNNFFMNSSVQDVQLSPNIVSIGDYAFYGCTNLYSLQLPENLITIGYKTFIGTSISEFKIPSSVKTIGSVAFESNINSLILEDCVNPITFGAYYYQLDYDDYFYYSKLDLSTFYKGREIELYEFSSFYTNGKNLSELSITGLNNCVDNEYQGNIQKLTLGYNIKSIKAGAFAKSNLEELKVYSPAPPEVDTKLSSLSPFSNYAYLNAKVYVPCGSLEIYKEAEYWKNFWNLYELPLVNPERIQLSVDEITIKDSEPVPLNYLIFPIDTSRQSISWLSENENIAIVDDNGCVSGISNGETQIVAICGDIRASCAVTVALPFVDAESIILNETTVSLNKGETIQLTAIVFPANVTDKTLKWVSQDESIAMVSNDGMVTAKGIGTTIISVTCGDVSATCEVVVTDIDGVGYFINEEEKINVYTVNGVLIKEGIQTKELKDLDPGIYIIQTPKGNFKIQK